MKRNPKIDAARVASSKIAAIVDEAKFELEFHFDSPRNPHGCLNDISNLRKDMCVAVEKLQQALRVIDAIDWPSDDEYEETWVEKRSNFHVVK